MNVRELIEELQKFDPDAVVFIRSWDCMKDEPTENWADSVEVFLETGVLIR